MGTEQIFLVETENSKFSGSHLVNKCVCLSRIMLRFLHFAANILKFKGFMGNPPHKFTIVLRTKNKVTVPTWIRQLGIAQNNPTSGWAPPVLSPSLLLSCLKDRCHPCGKDPKGAAIIIDLFICNSKNNFPCVLVS